MHYPSISTRIMSTLIDTVIVIIGGMWLASFVFEKVGPVPDSWRIFVLIALFFLYEPLTQAYGCSLGNYVAGIRVRRAADENKRIPVFSALVRFAVKIALGWLSFLTIHSNPKRQAMHDLAAGSVMVQARVK